GTVGGAEASFIGCSAAPEGPVGIEGPWLSDHGGLFFSPHDSEFALNNRQNLDANETDETFVAAAVPREGKDDTERFGPRTYKRTDGGWCVEIEKKNAGGDENVQSFCIDAAGVVRSPMASLFDGKLN